MLSLCMCGFSLGVLVSSRRLNEIDGDTKMSSTEMLRNNLSLENYPSSIINRSTVSVQVYIALVRANQILSKS